MKKIVLMVLMVACGVLFGGNYKLGIMSNSSGLGNNPEELFKQSKAIGLEGVQLNVGGNKEKTLPKIAFTGEEIETYKKLKKETGLEVASVCLGVLSAFPYDKTDGTELLLKDAIDACVKLDCDNILLPFFGPADLREKEAGDPKNRKLNIDPERLPNLIKKLKEIAPYAEKNGVVISIESTLGSDDHKKIIDGVGSKNVKVYFDTMNFETCGHNTIQGLKDLKGYLGQIHFKHKKNEFYIEDVPGNFPGIIDAVIDSGYKGWIVIEFSGFNAKKQGPQMNYVKKNVDWLKTTKICK